MNHDEILHEDALTYFPHFLVAPALLFPSEYVVATQNEISSFLTSIRQHDHEVTPPQNTSSFSYQAALFTARIYLSLKATNQSQSLLLRSHPSSDSFFVLNQLLSNFFTLSSKYTHKIHNRILAGHHVLAALGCVSTPENLAALKFAHATTLILHPKKKSVMGAKIALTLPLENLASLQGDGVEGFSFNIFAFLMAGTSAEEKFRYKLHQLSWPTHWEWDEAYDQYNVFLDALKTLGFSKATQASMVNLLVAILHLLNLEFVEGSNELTGNPETQVKHPDLLSFIASLLGVPLNDFRTCLVSKASLVGKDVCSVMLSVDAAKENAVHVAQLLYRTFFHWLLEFINKRLAPSLEPFTTPLTFTLLHFPSSPLLASQDASAITLNVSASSFTSLAVSIDPFLDDFVSKAFLTLYSAYHQDGLTLPPLSAAPSFFTSNKALPRLAYRDHVEDMNNMCEFFKTQAQEVLMHAIFTTTHIQQGFHSTLQEDLHLGSTSTPQACPYFVLPPKDVSESVLDWMRPHIELIPYLQRHVTHMPFSHVLQRYATLLPRHMPATDTRSKVRQLLESLGIEESSNWVMGQTSLWCSLDTLVQLESALNDVKAERRRMNETFDNMSFASETETTLSEADSNFEDALDMAYASMTIQNVENERRDRPRTDDEEQGPKSIAPTTSQKKTASMSPSRRRWLFFVKFLTWWIPSAALSLFGMKVEAVQTAWREKVAICICIFLFSASVLFVIVGAGMIICPRRSIYSLGELSALARKNKLYTSVYGRLYNLNALMVTNPSPFHNNETLFPLAGEDVSIGFPLTPLSSYCPLVRDSSLQLGVTSDSPFRTISTSHQAVVKANPMALNNYLSGKSRIVGDLAYTLKAIQDGWKLDPPKMMFVVDNIVYDLTLYFGTLSAMNNFPSYQFLGSANSSSNTMSLAQYIPLQASQGKVDLTNDDSFRQAWNNPSVTTCFNNVFRAGVLDERNSLKCLFTDYILLSMSVALCCIIFFKFFAALMLSGSFVTPASVEKFVILQVPCYTEDEKSLKNTFKSLATTKYDDKRKLLFVLCDGMIVGRGNDKPTPRIVLDLLGYPADAEDPIPHTYQAVGEGGKQENRARVYSGLYTVNGHVVPYIVVAKCGRASETILPGNRGKRDSQMVLLRFLNHVHYRKPMSPLEIELRHHMEDIIGVDPTWYEYLMMVDADTVVDTDALGKLVSFSMTDSAIIGCCGETRIDNEKATLATMIQVYEYFISHHVSKAFESMFGTVTCLPGCFTIFRLKDAANDKPLLVHDAIVEEYAVVNVNTLHKKNLLTLGEDRYLTTLILKAFPRMKTKFTASTACSTFVPESFSVLLSQRRRWINSTFHNLFELIWLQELCGFCCFSMRFVVLIDLISTIIMPATVVYLGYLIYLTVLAVIKNEGFDLVLVSLILIACIYGLQAIVFILKKEFSHIVWMLLYILAIPLFGFFLPIYSFWNMNDFSWGNTRVVVGEKGEKKVVFEEMEAFDISQIPHVTWEEHKASSASIPTASQPAPAPRARPASTSSRRSSVNSRGYIERSSPTDAELRYEIERILSSTDLMKISKRQVRERLSGLFGVDLFDRKAFISEVIEEYLDSLE